MNKWEKYHTNMLFLLLASFSSSSAFSPWRFNCSRHSSFWHRRYFNYDQRHHPWWAPLWLKPDFFTDPVRPVSGKNTLFVRSTTLSQQIKYRVYALLRESRPHPKGNQITSAITKIPKHFIWQFSVELHCKTTDIFVILIKLLEVVFICWARNPRFSIYQYT